MLNKILIVDDDVQLSMLLKKCIENEAVIADVCNDGETALKAVHQNKYQLIVLDIMMPGMDGFEVIEKIRKISEVPIMMLTAKDKSTDKVHGLRLGADDYLTKPFDVDEFIARVFSLIRRYTVLNGDSDKDEHTLSFHGLEINMDTYTVTSNGKIVDLHAKEFEILSFLAKNQGKIVTKQQIYEEVWQEQYSYDDNNIMSYISKLRKKIEPNPNKPTYIQTVKGIGYRFIKKV